MQMSPASKNPSYQIPTLKLPRPTFGGTVRKFSGMASETSVGDNLKGKGRGFSKAKWTSTV